VAGQAEIEAMRRAIMLAARGLGRTSPNPVVGCVILDAHGNTVGEGFHARAGGPHAEVEALTVAGAGAERGTAVVTLEPCTHTGRTGPCVQALLDAGIARVVVAVDDPNPLAAGGVAALRAAGVEVETGVLTREAADGNAGWLTSVRDGRPYLIWKFASALDGRSAAADGTSRWITGPDARADVHRLRDTCDTIVAGVGTVLADDPELTVRLQHHDGHQPLRVVVDSAGRTPPGARVRPAWIATAAEVGADPDGRVDLRKLMSALYERGARRVLLEGGPTLAGAFLRAGLVDRVVAYVAPALLGAGPAALADAGISGIDEALRLNVTDVVALGPDIRITGNLKEA
jgi:diaminohydroxyphosphoribosylaminopyrimidine deaminase / 5-amino-6-(5-phosphoribosylamino)uracil reductase